MLQTLDGTGTDVALLRRIVARDPAALAELYDRHQRLLYGLVLRIVRDRAESEEALQEIFLAVWTRAASYDANQNVVTVRYTYKVSRPVFVAEEYLSVKDFYKKMVEMLNEPLVLKKK